jgi:hypothetical protein
MLEGESITSYNCSMSKIDLLSLRPTQFALGMLEVETKVRKLQKLSDDELKDYLKEHPVPVVRAPDGEVYLIDHHHLVRACWELGIDKLVLEEKEDFSKLSEEQFWKKMDSLKWLYLHDQFGKGPHSATLLPRDVRGLADDPFRSLAWALREEKGFNKSPVPFCEFSWAEFLRSHILIHPAKIGFKEALKHAVELCHKPEAKKLPGYIE